MALALLAAGDGLAGMTDSLPRHWGASLTVIPGRIIVMDRYQKQWQRGKKNWAFDVTATYQPMPSDSDDFARDYLYPTFNFGLRYAFNHGVTCWRSPDQDWGKAQAVDYVSRLGNVVSLYAGFERYFFRTRRWSADYQLNFGVGYSHRIYNKENNIDDELIGSHWLIFFGAGLHIGYRLTRDWGLKAGVEYYHHSNGALDRPNKGANYWGPTVGVVYEPSYEKVVEEQHRPVSSAFRPHWTGSVSVGIGAKTLDEDWQVTQFRTDPDDPDYRTSHFHLYPAFSLSADLLRRYERRWASGVAVDIFYGTYADHVREVNAEQGYDSKVSPWSIGLAARHAVYYHRWSLQMSLGYYLLRRMGYMAKEQEQRYYERIGICYDFAHLRVGMNVKAHRTKADLTEVVIAWTY